MLSWACVATRTLLPAQRTTAAPPALLQFTIDSCGTGGGSPDWYMPGGFSYHEGDAADSRMRAAASGRGVKLTSRSRPLKPADLAEFDYIVGMDASNLVAIRRAAEYWAGSGRHAVPEDWSGKVGGWVAVCEARLGGV